jgi:RNA polymerase sigma factor (sigma-70 family)
MSSKPEPRRGKRSVLAAMMIGTALTALGPAVGRASEAPSETTLKAINDIDRYCAACWRNARLPMDSWTDCTQEVFQRLLERVPENRWDETLRGEGDERRELVRAIDAVKKRTQRARRWTSPLDGVADRRETHARKLHEQREAVRQAAEEVLSPRQRQIVQMSFDGWSVQEMSRELSLPPERISDEKYKAIRKLQAKLS